MRPQAKYVRVDASNPLAAGQCDRCGFWWQLHRLQFQLEWSGMQLYNTRKLVCPKCLDVPFEQLRTIILPPDPLPVEDARVPNFVVEES